MVQRILRLVFFTLCFVSIETLSLAQSPPIFGPNKYLRATGAPNVYSGAFRVCNPGATYKLIIENGDGELNRVSAATIMLNGQEVVKNNEFSQKVDKIEKTVSLLPENTIDVKLAGGPGGFIRHNG